MGKPGNKEGNGCGEDYRRAFRGSLDQYYEEIKRHPVLSRDEEFELAKRVKDDGDPEAVQALVTANLRFVVKVAFEYRKYGMNMQDMIQEGNMGLMIAVQKFDPQRGYRLISYAVWWIKGYIQEFILKNWSLVKLGNTSENRKILFGKRSTSGEEVDARDEAFGLGLQDSEGVRRRDLPLDAILPGSGGLAALDLALATLATEHFANTGSEEMEAGLIRSDLRRAVSEAFAELEPGIQFSRREQYILDQRILADEPITLEQIGSYFGVTRERARQIEVALRLKLWNIPELQLILKDYGEKSDLEAMEALEAKDLAIREKQSVAHEARRIRKKEERRARKAASLPIAPQEDADRAEEDFEVEQKGPVFNVETV